MCQFLKKHCVFMVPEADEETEQTEISNLFDGLSDLLSVSIAVEPCVVAMADGAWPALPGLRRTTLAGIADVAS